MDVNHREWIAQCLQIHWGKHVSIDQDIGAYFENMSNGLHRAEVSISSLSSTVTSDDGIFCSDPESESSKGTVSEKHNCEYREKELCLEKMDACKKGSDDEDSNIQRRSACKKRPLSDEEDGDGCSSGGSVHRPEPGGLSIGELVAYTGIKGRKGLQREYAQIKAEPVAGTFEESKLVALCN